MKQEDIINKIVEEFDVARIDAAEIVNNIFSILRNSLIKGKHINISEFGKFDVNYKKGENEKILKTISFSPVKKFSYDVNDSFNNLEPVTVAFITNFKDDESMVDTDMEDYEEIIDEIDEKEFIKSRITVVEEKTIEKEKPAEKKIEAIADDRRKSFFDSDRYKVSRNIEDTPESEETISDKILSKTIEKIEIVDAPETIDSDEITETIETPDFFVDREEPEEPLVVEFKESQVTDEQITEEQVREEVDEPVTEAGGKEGHGYLPTEKELLDFEKIREELNNKIKETFGEITVPESVFEPPVEDEIKQEELEQEIKEEFQTSLTEDVSEIESKEIEIRTPKESNILEEDLITQQETTEEPKPEQPKTEEQSFKDMFEEKEKLFDERDEILKEIENKISEDFAKLDEDDFKDIDSETIRKIEEINKSTEEKLKSQTPDDEIKIPDFDFKNLFKDSVAETSIPETELPEEEAQEETIREDIKEEREREGDLSYEGSDILIPEEIKQLHEEIQTVKPFDELETKKEETLFQNGDEEDVKFDFFKDYNDIFEDKDGEAGVKITHPSGHSQMPYPKKDATDEQKEGSKIFSLSIMILIGIVIAVFAGIYFLLSSDLFKPKPAPVVIDSVKNEQQVVPGINDSAKQNQSKDTTRGKDSVSASQQSQKPDTAKSIQTSPTIESNNQTASNPEDAQYRKLNPGEEEQINDPANNVVYIRTADGVYIQTGSYKDKAVAENKANALKKAGINNVSVVEANLGDKGVYYRVRVGKYPTVQEAKNNSQKVKI